MTISNELLDELLKDCKRPEDLLGDAGLMKELKIRLMERMLGAEQSNCRNGVAARCRFRFRVTGTAVPSRSW